MSLILYLQSQSIDNLSDGRDAILTALALVVEGEHESDGVHVAVVSLVARVSLASSWALRSLPNDSIIEVVLASEPLVTEGLALDGDGVLFKAVEGDLAWDHVELDLLLGKTGLARVVHSLISRSEYGVLARGEVNASSLCGSREELEVEGLRMMGLSITVRIQR